MSKDFTELVGSGQFVCLRKHKGYGVSTDGRIWSCWKGRQSPILSDVWNTLRCYRRTDGVTAVILYRPYRQTFLVHRLVLEAFVGPCPEGMMACHADDNPTNNNLSNLRWGTIHDNLADAYRNGRIHQGALRKFAKLVEKDIHDIFAMHYAGISNLEIADRKGISPPNVCNILKRRAWKHINIKS